jgi:hypothetical protein
LTIEGLGSLRKDSSGKISFIEAPEIIEIENKGAAEPERIPEVAEKKEIPIIIEQKTAEEKEIPDEVRQVIQEKPKSKTTASTRSKTAKAPAKVKSARISKPLPKSVSADIPMKVTESSFVEPEPAIEASTPLTQEAVDAAVAELKSSIEPASKDSLQSFTPVPPTASMPLQSDELDGNSYRTRPAVSTNRILAWVLIILFVNAGILAWFVFRNKTKGTPAGKSATTMISDTLYDRLADSVRAAAMDSSIVYNEVPDEGGNLKDNAVTPGSRYYIVAGCFRDEINADSLVSSLKLLGYKAEKFGKIGNLFAVCFASFDNKDAAVSELKKIREKVPSAWMTKF